MKRLMSFVIISSLLLTLPAFSQVNIDGLGFNYSALVRDTAGKIQLNKPVKLRFTLLLGQNGTIANSPWIETQNLTTDAFGFVNTTIGSGSKAGGTAARFADVDFGVANQWILIEVLNSFSNAYEPLTKQALQAVPYAKVAGAVAGNQLVPTGTILAFAGDSAHVPNGWLLCNGIELDNTDARYTALFNAIGYAWGTSNHLNKFNIPDTRGYFLRGNSSGTGRDAEAADRIPFMGGNAGDQVGSYQDDAFKSHNHGGGNHSHNWMSSVTIDSWGGNVVIGGNGNGNRGVPNSGVIIATEGSTETRPKNVSVNYIIKL